MGQAVWLGLVSSAAFPPAGWLGGGKVQSDLMYVQKFFRNVHVTLVEHGNEVFESRPSQASDSNSKEGESTAAMARLRGCEVV